MSWKDNVFAKLLDFFLIVVAIVSRCEIICKQIESSNTGTLNRMLFKVCWLM